MISHVAAGLTVLVGVLVLTGWIFDIETLKNVLPGLVEMKANTAAAFICTGVSLGLSTPPQRNRLQWTIAKVTALAASLMGAATLVEYRFSLNLGIDEFLLRDLGTTWTSVPGRPSPATAFNFMMLGTALMLLPWGQRAAQWFVQGVGIAVLLNSTLAVVGFLFGVDSLYTAYLYSAMALNTAVSFILMGIGLLASRSDFELLAPFRSHSVGGKAARALLPAVVGVPIAFGWVGLQGQRLGFFGLDFGMAVYASSMMVTLLVVVWWSSRRLNQSDDQRTQAAGHLAQVRNELAHAMRLNTMGEMAAGIAHELNQPLSAISNFARGAARRLHDGFDDKAELIEVANSIADESARAAEIIRSLKQYVKKAEPQWAAIDINTVVQGAARIVGGEAHQRGVAITLCCAPQLPQIHGDGIQLKQVIVNLLSNGLDSLESRHGDKWLAVETRLVPTGAIEVLVDDNGNGLPETDENKIFNAFFTTKPDGLGMGLAISRSLIEAHGGRLWAERNARGGATFRFIIPLEYSTRHEN